MTAGRASELFEILIRHYAITFIVCFNLTSVTFPIIDTKTIQNLCHNLKRKVGGRDSQGKSARAKLCYFYVFYPTREDSIFTHRAFEISSFLETQLVFHEEVGGNTAPPAGVWR
jgi:hypothetical protein